MLAQPLDHRKQPVGFRARQRRCRLVEDHNLGLVRHGARDGHHLPIGERKLGDAGGKVNLQPKSVGDRLRLAPDAARIEKQRRALAGEPVHS